MSFEVSFAKYTHLFGCSRLQSVEWTDEEENCALCIRSVYVFMEYIARKPCVCV